MIKHLTTKTVIAAGAATLAISAMSAPADAAVITYTDRTAWQNALNTLGWSATPQEQFNTNIANASFITFDNGVISQGFDGEFDNSVSVALGRYVGSVAGSINLAPGGVFDTIRWTFPSTRGFGADWIETATAAGLRVTIAGQTIVFGDVPGFTGKNVGETGFLGFISDTAFTSATFSGGGGGAIGDRSSELFQADNLSYAQFNGDPTVVPTPALLPGLIGMGIAAWRKRKAEAADSEV